MKKCLLLLLCVIAQCYFLNAQTKSVGTTSVEKIKKNQFNISLGIGLEDGLIFLPKNALPTFGLSYERNLSKRFSADIHSLIYYRAVPDSYTFGYPDYPDVDKLRGSVSPFMTQADKDKLANSGIKNLNPDETVKFLSIPIDIGITFYPLSKKHHRIGIYAGFGLTYEAHNWYRDLWVGTVTLQDGSQKQITLNVPTEFRNLSAGFSTKIKYEYAIKDYACGFRIGNNNVILTEWFDANESVWEISLFWAFKF